MPHDLVFEILCEKLPCATLESVLDYIPKKACENFQRYRVKYSDIEVVSSPNRISLLVHDISSESCERIIETKGPRVSSPESAIEGFLKKVGKKSKDDLEIKEINGVNFYYHRHHESDSESLESRVTTVIKDIIENFPMDKRMRWGDKHNYWVRPVISVACVLHGKVQEISVAGVQASNTTYGNIFFLKKSHTISDIKGYLSFLDKNMVIPKYDTRLECIIKQIDEQIAESGLHYNKQDKILKTLNGMLEYPRVLIGKIDEEFRELPKEVVLCVLTNHQRYLALYDENNNIVKFASVGSTVNDTVIKTHETVLRARLSDALFLMESDRKNGMDHYVESLSKIVFKNELGSMLDKVRRMSSLAKYVSVWVPHSSILNAERASLLSKADLATLIVKEFPELQGVIGKYYAQNCGECREVCLAIEEHYLPVSHSDRCPSSPTGIAVAIADKVDTLVGLMATERISGSRDPFALRRTSISLIRLILENDILIPLDIIVSKSVYMYTYEVRKRGNNKTQSMFHSKDKDYIVSLVLNFCYERLKVILQNKGIDKNVVSSAMNNSSDLLLIKRKAKVANDYLKTERGRAILAAYKRISNVVSSCDPTVSRSHNIKCNKRLLIEEPEKDLFSKIKYYDMALKEVLKSNNFHKTLDMLYEFSVTVNTFMDKVLVHEKSVDGLSHNRINLSLLAVETYNKVLDWEKIPKDF